jgi:hypothetical protein
VSRPALACLIVLLAALLPSLHYLDPTDATARPWALYLNLLYGSGWLSICLIHRLSLAGRRRDPLCHQGPRRLYTRRLPRLLSIGHPMWVEGPYGRFVFDDDKPRQIWVAGGIGMPPSVARMQELAASGAASGQ